MENTELAAIFEEIANYLQIKGENPFKIRAYQNAARVLESLNESAAAIHQRGELEQIDGIGKAIAEKIAEALNTGRIPYHEELKATMPDGILDLLHVPNLGPKKVKLVWDQLGITTVPDLKAAAEAGQLQSLPGMGKKSEEKILRGIENLEQYAKRHLLGLTYPIAQEFLDRVKTVKGVEAAEIAGSLRRGKETVGDVDILVATSNGEPAVKAFLDDNRITEIIAKGTTKTSVALKNGLHIDLRIVDRSEFGAALQYFTGSKEHNVKLREMAVRQGLKVSEYGVFEIQTEKRIAGKTEEEVYRAIGTPYIAPELREGLDELELAKSNTLPKLIERKDIQCALHNHTTASDGLLSLEELVKESRARGYKYIAITDHSAGLGVANGLSEDRLKARIEEIHQLNETLNDFRILTGTEVDIRANGELDYPDELLEQLDIVIAAIHGALEQPKEKMTARVCNALQNPNVDFLSHPTGRLMGRRPPIQLDMEKLFETAQETGAALEINSHFARLDLNDRHILEAKQYGIQFTLETDTHTLDHFDNLPYGLKTARRGRLEANDVLNTLSLKQLGKKKRKKKTF